MARSQVPLLLVDNQNIMTILKREEGELQPEHPTSEEKWEWLEDMIQILLFYEIYKRRHDSGRGILRF